MAAAACLTAAALAATQPLPNIRPRHTPAAIERALVAEHSGNPAAAEQILLEVARLDHLYLPAWSLANFYFRQNDAVQFWVWATRAASLTNDPRPLLRLANILAPDPRGLVDHLGDRPEILRPYLDLLIAESRFSDAQLAATLLGAHHDPADLPRFDALRKILSPGGN